MLTSLPWLFVESALLTGASWLGLAHGLGRWRGADDRALQAHGLLLGVVIGLYLLVRVAPLHEVLLLVLIPTGCVVGSEGAWRLFHQRSLRLLESHALVGVASRTERHHVVTTTGHLARGSRFGVALGVVLALGVAVFLGYV